MQWLQSLAGEIGRDIHRAAVELRPTALDDLGLREALATLLREWTLRHGIRSDLQFLGETVRLPADIETAIYRIVQEALTNILKHAQARTVSVSVERRHGGGARDHRGRRRRLRREADPAGAMVGRQAPPRPLRHP